MINLSTRFCPLRVSGLGNIHVGGMLRGQCCDRPTCKPIPSLTSPNNSHHSLFHQVSKMHVSDFRYFTGYRGALQLTFHLSAVSRPFVKKMQAALRLVLNRQSAGQRSCELEQSIDEE